MKVVAISDTHLREADLPDADLLIVGGDVTSIGTAEQVAQFNSYLKSQAHKFKHKPLVIAGNHDFLFQQKRDLAETLMESAIYVEDRLIEIDGVRIYGSPWTPTFGNWAFMKDRGNPIRDVWDSIPEKLDILVTHGPPVGILDYCRAGHVGCEELLKVVQRELNHPPRFHVFGHIHEGYGRHQTDSTTFLNVAVCNFRYQLANAPTVFEV